MKKMKIDYVHCPMRKFWRVKLRVKMEVSWLYGWESIKIVFLPWPTRGLKKKKSGAGGYAQISDCYVMYLLCYSIAGHSLGALMYLKTWSGFPPEKWESIMVTGGSGSARRA